MRSYDDLVSDPMHLVTTMIRQHDAMAEVLNRFHLQVIEIPDHLPGLVIGDTPVVHALTSSNQYGFRDRLALGDANLIVGPLTARAPPPASRSSHCRRRLSELASRSTHSMLCSSERRSPRSLVIPMTWCVCSRPAGDSIDYRPRSCWARRSTQPRSDMPVVDEGRMAYIVQRKNRFFVVDYDGVDPITGRERRKWRLVGSDRTQAEELAARLDLERAEARPPRSPTSLGGFLIDTWLPRKGVHVRATTHHRYRWIVQNYLLPHLGDVALASLRPDHLDHLYEQLLNRGGKDGGALSPKTVHEVHLIVRNALDLALHRQLVDRNVALVVHSPRRRGGGIGVARVWSAQELATFLDFARTQRLFPAIHLAAHTGMRRGEVVGLKWGDLDPGGRRLSIHRTVQTLDGRPVEFGAKTRTSRRSVDLDGATADLLRRWRRRLHRDGLPSGPDDWMFPSTTGRFLNPQSLSQLFGRLVGRSGLPKVRFHDLRHTHASLLVASGTPIKVVTERLGHAHPAFTMHTYQHLLPGMSAEAADRFARLVAAAGRSASTARARSPRRSAQRSRPGR